MLELFINNAFAQQATQAATQPNAITSFLPLILIMLVFYFLIIRPQSKKARDHRTLLESIVKGDEIVTAGGIFGKVQKIETDNNILQVEIADNVRIRVRRELVSEVIRPQAA